MNVIIDSENNLYKWNNKLQKFILCSDEKIFVDVLGDRYVIDYDNYLYDCIYDTIRPQKLCRLDEYISASVNSILVVYIDYEYNINIDKLNSNKIKFSFDKTIFTKVLICNNHCILFLDIDGKLWMIDANEMNKCGLISNYNSVIKPDIVRVSKKTIFTGSNHKSENFVGDLENIVDIKYNGKCLVTLNKNNVVDVFYIDNNKLNYRHDDVTGYWIPSTTTTFKYVECGSSNMPIIRKICNSCECDVLVQDVDDNFWICGKLLQNAHFTKVNFIRYNSHSVEINKVGNSHRYTAISYDNKIITNSGKIKKLNYMIIPDIKYKNNIKTKIDTKSSRNI